MEEGACIETSVHQWSELFQGYRAPGFQFLLKEDLSILNSVNNVVCETSKIDVISHGNKKHIPPESDITNKKDFDNEILFN